jgi:hypothetical protein
MAVFLLPATLAAVAPLTPLRSSVGPLSIPAMPGVRGRRLSAIRLSETTPRAAANARPVKAESWTPPPPKDGDYVDIFCRATNSFFESTTLPFIREAVTLRASQGPLKPLQRLTSPPESPGLSRPVWLVIAASVPTGLLWYGYYKFSVEEELFYDELRREGRVTGCGGYGTLISFSWLVLLGLLGKAVGAPAADALIDGAALWILLGQVNLYRRANELCTEKACGVEGPPLYAWWALLPPPLDVVVGLRQVRCRGGKSSSGRRLRSNCVAAFLADRVEELAPTSRSHPAPSPRSFGMQEGYNLFISVPRPVCSTALAAVGELCCLDCRMPAG